MSDWIENYHEDLRLHTRIRVEHPTRATYEVRKLYHRQDDDKLLFNKREGRRWVLTEDEEEGAILVRGDIKWDGCSDNYVGEGGYVHMCSREDLTNLAILFDRLFDQAMELLGDRSREFLEPCKPPEPSRQDLLDAVKKKMEAILEGGLQGLEKSLRTPEMFVVMLMRSIREIKLEDLD